MKLLVIIPLSALLGACAQLSPGARISRDTPRFENLPPEHQELARKGNISTGMSQDAVYFAWGRPAMVTTETRKKQQTVRWDFARLRPVTRDPDAYTSYARAFTHPSYPDQLTSTVRPSRDPLPYRTATVWFMDGKVTEWERIQ